MGMMKILFGIFFLAWLTTTLNNYQKICRSNSFLNGNIQEVATTALREDARTRQELILTPMSSQQSSNGLKCFFKPFVTGTIIPEMNKKLVQDKHHPVSYGEFLCWIGLWFLMATINGPEHQEFWSLGEIDMFAGAPMRLGIFMSQKRFDAILKAFLITSSDPPDFRDCFWEIHDILKAWNENMTEYFTPSWVSCLDKSMSTWTNKYSCPGWMFMPCKPWPFGNEYHMECCSLSGILWQMEMVEGKDDPSQIVPKFNDQGKTVGAYLWQR